jgi:LDH2 family malate/lactate/ureidoglycolate dehydrogenase
MLKQISDDYGRTIPPLIGVKDMVKVNWEQLSGFIHTLFLAVGMSKTDAEVMTEVYVRATARGVGHHDIYDLPDRIKSLFEKRINPNPKIQLQSQFNALESYNGDHGPGELCAAFITRRGNGASGCLWDWSMYHL